MSEQKKNRTRKIATANYLTKTASFKWLIEIVTDRVSETNFRGFEVPWRNGFNRQVEQGFSSFFAIFWQI